MDGLRSGVPVWVTMAEVGRRAGVSVSTVSRALGGHPGIPEVTRRRVRRAAEELGYRPDPLLGVLMSRVRGKRAASPVNLACLYGSDLAPGMDRLERAFLDGVAAGAEASGYAVLMEPWRAGRPPLGSLLRRWRAANVQGVVLYGVRAGGEWAGMPWDEFCWVVSGNTVVGAALHRVGNEIYQLVKLGLQEALACGYRRPGLAVPLEGPLREGFRWAGAFAGNHMRYLPVDPAPLVYRGDWCCAGFQAWLGRERPDAVFALTDGPLGWMESGGLGVPADAGFIHLAANLSRRGAAGVSQDFAGVGAAAVQSLDGLLRRGERGVPGRPGTYTIAGRWADGWTVRGRDPSQ